MGSGGFFYSSSLKGEACPVDFFIFSENLEILPMGNVRHFRRIRKNDILFLQMFVFREHLVMLCVCRGNLMNSCLEVSEFLGNSTNSTLGKRASFSQNSQK